MSNDRGSTEERACGLCGRAAQDLTRHHLIPRTRHKNKRNKKMFDRQEIHRTVDLCRPCHRHIHATLDNKTLEREYNTVESLLSHPDIRRFVDWIRNKPHGTVRRGPRRDDWTRASRNSPCHPPRHAFRKAPPGSHHSTRSLQGIGNR